MPQGSRREVSPSAISTAPVPVIADLVRPRVLHAAIVRSPAAHARIRSPCRAAAAPGVLLLLNGADLLQLLPPPVPEGQISMPSKWTSVIQHKFSIRSSRYWGMKRCGMSARRLRSIVAESRE